MLSEKEIADHAYARYGEAYSHSNERRIGFEAGASWARDRLMEAKVGWSVEAGSLRRKLEAQVAENHRLAARVNELEELSVQTKPAPRSHYIGGLNSGATLYGCDVCGVVISDPDLHGETLHHG